MNKTTNVDQSYLFINILALLYFKIFRSTRNQYQISTGIVIVLVAVYLLTQFRKRITINKLKHFITYYDSDKIGKYISVLIDRKLVIIDNSNKVVVYMITQAGIQVIEEIQQNYNKVIYDFCEKYNIVL